MTEDILHVVLKYDIRIVSKDGYNFVTYSDLPDEFLYSTGFAYKGHNGTPCFNDKLCRRTSPIPAVPFRMFLDKVVEYDRTR